MARIKKMIFGVQAPKKGFKPDFVTITEKNLSKNTKLNAVIIPKAKFMSLIHI